MSKKLQVLDQVDFKKNYKSPVHLDLKKDLIQSLWFFSKMPKKLQVLDQVHFKKNYNDWINQHLYFFLLLI